eukprot:4892167-Prymnesium_polylepis.2
MGADAGGSSVVYFARKSVTGGEGAHPAPGWISGKSALRGLGQPPLRTRARAEARPAHRRRMRKYGACACGLGRLESRLYS